MPNETILRVAQALCKENGDDWNRDAALHDGYIAQARVAVEALREPSEAMLTAMYDESVDNGDYVEQEFAPKIGAWTWTAAIDTALKEVE